MPSVFPMRALALCRGALFSALLLLAACARPMPPELARQPMPVSFLPAPGEFLSAAGDPLTAEAFRKLATDAAYILVGEGHGNACDHQAEARVLTILAHGGTPQAPGIAVGLEMAPATLDPVLAAFSRGEFPPEDLEKRLDWKTNWGHPFNKYLPVLRTIRDWRLPVFGLNVPPGVIRRLSAAALQNATAADPVAALSPEDRAFLPARIIPPAPEQLGFLHEVMQGHLKGGAAHQAVDPRQEARFLLIQSVWDSAMAERAVSARTASGLPVAVLAGAGHVDGGLGIARRLGVLDPGAKILLVSPWRGGEFDPADAAVRFYCPESFESRMGMTLEARPDGDGAQVLVTSVRRGSRAQDAGLRPGDVVERAGGYRMRTLEVLHIAGSDAFREKKNLVFVVRRGEERLEVDLGPLGQGGR